MKQEIWKIIEEFPNYEISNFGNVKNSIKQCDMQGNVIKEFNSINEAAKTLGISACNISNCLAGRQKSTPRNLYT